MNLARLAETHVRFVDDVSRAPEKQYAVHQRSQDLDAVVAVGFRGRGRLLRHPRGEQCEGQGAGIGEHVHRVGEQGQTVGVETTYDLDDQVSQRERECDAERAPAFGCR